MALDPSIYFQQQGVQLPDPVNKLAQLGQVQQFQNQNALAQLQLSQAQRANDQAEGLNRLYQAAVKPDGTVDRAALFTSAAQQGLGSVIPGLQKQFADADKATADVGKTKAETGKITTETLNATLQQGRDILTQANDPATARQWLQAQYANPDTAAIFNKLGPVDQALARFDQQTATPEGFARWKQGAMLTAQELVKQTMPDANTVLNAQVSRQNNSDTNATSRANNAANVAVARDRLNFDQSQPKGVYDKDNGIIVDPRTGKSIAVTDQNGQPIQGGGGKMTEDQSKATGWLIQAENAFKNMQGAIQRTPSASKPGFNDALAAIPSFGAGAAVANSLRGADRQQFLQGASSLSEALLRAATGAGVNESEARQKIAEITPVPGDKDENIAQKMAAIPLYLESLRVRAGPGAKKAAAVLSNQPAPATSSDGWTVTQVK